MSDMKNMIAETADRLFSDLIDSDFLHKAETLEKLPDLWSAVEETGFSRVMNSEEKGGAVGDWDDAGALAFAIGYHGVPVPLAETIVVNHLMEQAGMTVVGGPVSISVFNEGYFSPCSLSAGEHLLVARDGKLSLFQVSELIHRAGRNMAGEVRDRFDDLPESPLQTAHTDQDVFSLMAAMRAGQLAGAMARVLDLTIEYAMERQQFGKPVSKFQAVQQQLAVAGCEVAAAQRSSENAFIQMRDNPEVAKADIAVAKIRCGEAAEKVGRIAHAVHGAIGITQEYQLHLFTRRLWSWRTEFGSEGLWSQRLGQAAFAVGDNGLWPAITSNGLRL